MKKIDWLCITLALFTFGFFLGVVSENIRSGSESMVIASIQKKIGLEIIDVDITAYSPSPHITAGDPFTMASGRRARPTELEQLRFVAVSRDLMKLYGLEYGDTIWISFTVEDTMHPRIENTVDLFMRNLDLARKFGRQKRQIIMRRR